jgi:hypothetical protein
MNRMFEVKKESLDKELATLAQSPALRVLGQGSTEDEWRVIMGFSARTLVLEASGDVTLAGPVVCGIRYHARFLSEAPHPSEVSTVLEPCPVYHPHCHPVTGAWCLGHLQAGVSLEFIVHLIWAGINLNMKVIDARPGNVLNRDAAHWVAVNAHRLPVSAKGFWEQPDFASDVQSLSQC